MRRIALLLLLVAHTTLSTAQTTRPAAGQGIPESLGEVRDDRLTEVSGIAASRRNPGCYYVHNDSGDQPRVFLIGRDGATRLVINLTGAAAVDYEDIALVPAADVPGRFDVCVADIGDNRARRPDLTIYRFPEPALADTKEPAISVKPTAYRFRYADGPANAEAWFVDPRTGDGYIVTKAEDGVCGVYKLPAPWPTEGVTTLPRLLTLTLPPGAVTARVVTAADMSPDGRRLALRCYVNGWEWRLPAKADGAQLVRVLATPPTRLLLAPESQGEAICYAADGSALLTVSEGRHPLLYELQLAPTDSAP
ncbi:MAG: hypothetical protein PVJ57_14870 [Phycisphaerae bacterium]